MARLRQLETLKLWLADLPQKSGLKINAQTAELEFSTEKDSEEKKMMPKEKAALMENMAQLWLQQEVKDLERNYENYSTYVIVDHLAMIHHMFAVKDIVACKRFAVIVPSTGRAVILFILYLLAGGNLKLSLLSVVQQLDSLKKSDVRARNAIRWLEKQFQAG